MSSHLSKIKNVILDGLCILIGSLLFAVAVNVFTAPNNIAPGGLTGIATMLNYSFGLPIGTMILVMNLPLFILGFLTFGRRYLVKTVIATILSSLLIDATSGLMPAYRGDPLIVVVFGGVLSGAGLALVLMREATTGGTELAANIINQRFPHISTAKFMMLLDVIVVAASAFVYREIESPLYAVMVIFITSWVIDAILYGTNIGTGKMMFIVSPKNREIAALILDKMERGVTQLKSRGAYSGNEGEVLLCAVRRPEVYRVYRLVHSIDPDAFIIVGDAGEITGEGFRRIPHPAKRNKR